MHMIWRRGICGRRWSGAGWLLELGKMEAVVNGGMTVELSALNVAVCCCVCRCECCVKAALSSGICLTLRHLGILEQAMRPLRMALMKERVMFCLSHWQVSYVVQPCRGVCSYSVRKCFCSKHAPLYSLPSKHPKCPASRCSSASSLGPGSGCPVVGPACFPTAGLFLEGALNPGS